MSADLLILPNEIIVQLYRKVSEKKKGKTPSVEEIKEELTEFLIKIDNPGWKYLIIEFRNGKEGLSVTTVAKALNRVPKQSEWGAAERLRNLICYYSFKISWIDTLIRLSLSEDEIRIISRSMRKGGNRSESQDKILKKEFSPFEKATDDYKILILPFRNPEKNYEISSVGRNLADGLKTKNEEGNFGLEIAYHSEFLDMIEDKIAKEIGMQVGADMVIWGNNVNLSKVGHRIYFHYAALTSKTNVEAIPNIGRVRDETDSLIEITEGNLQLEVEECIHWFIGSKFYHELDFEKAIIHFLKLEPYKYQSENIFLSMAQSYHALNNYWMARHYYDEALKVNPHSIYALTNLAMLMSESVKLIPNNIGIPIEFRAAPQRIVKRYFEKALKIDPNHWQMHHMYASFLEKKPSNKASTAMHYEKALELHPTPYTLNNYALLLSANGDFKKSEELFLKGLEMDNKAWILHYNYAQFLDVDLNEPLKAQYHYLKAISYCADNKQKVYTLLGYAILLADKFEDHSLTQRYFDEALKLVPQFPLVSLNYAIFMKEKLTQQEKAKQLYLNAVKLSRKVRSVQRDAYFGNSALINLIKKMAPRLFQKKINYSIYNKIKNNKSIGTVKEIV